MNVQVEELCKRVEENSLRFTKALSKSMPQSSVCACVFELKAFFCYQHKLLLSLNPIELLFLYFSLAMGKCLLLMLSLT